MLRVRDFCVALTLLLLTAALAAAQPAPSAPAPLGVSEYRVYRNAAGESLPYRLLKPRDCSRRYPYPLVLFLHGSGERGSDNTSQLANGVRELFASAEARANYHAFVVVPQCPDGQSWSEFGEESDKLTAPSRLALELIGALGREFSIDPTRLYIVGLSMGGFGTWDIIARYPDLFAAAVPICGGGDPSQAAKLINLPIWAFHGDKDDTVDVDFSRSMTAAIEAAGGHPRYTEYPGVGHDSWVRAFREPDLLPWLFAQMKGCPCWPE